MQIRPEFQGTFMYTSKINKKKQRKKEIEEFVQIPKLFFFL